MAEWRKNTSAKEKLMLTNNCSANSGSASCKLTPMREETSCPMSVDRAESLRPKSSTSSDTERSHSTVRLIFSTPLAASFQYSGRS